MKVFSVAKYVEDMKSKGLSDSYIRSNLVDWAAKCHGLTEAEMGELGLLAHKKWMEKRKRVNNMKYKVGDKVRVRSYLVVGVTYGNLRFLEGMRKLRGSVVTITYVTPTGNFNFMDTEYILSPDMLEPLEETFKVGDVVYAKKNGVELKVTETDLYRLETKDGTAWFMKKELLTHTKPKRLQKITREELADMGYEVQE